ncbi:MAG: RelA/SpoT domain-containing protein [Gaiellaceae bacterium]|nr:RelA/SpoT domain-containing protein [Gaiellaceae bacterium]
MLGLPYSRSAIDRAGVVLRDWYLEGRAADSWSGRAPHELEPHILEAAEVVWAYRALFRKPLTKVTVGLRQFVQRESSQIIVSQRLKRLPTIIDKLARFPAMNVTQMQDIGGCRAILPGGRPEIEGVLRRIEKNRWEVRLHRDYISEPKDTGYRAIHVVVVRDECPIEIQLRTPNQHAWAAQTERVGAMLGIALKDGVGPDDLVDFFRLVALSLAYQDEGRAPDMRHRTKFVRTYQAVQRRYPEIFT